MPEKTQKTREKNYKKGTLANIRHKKSMTEQKKTVQTDIATTFQYGCLR